MPSRPELSTLFFDKFLYTVNKYFQKADTSQDIPDKPYASEYCMISAILVRTFFKFRLRYPGGCHVFVKVHTKIMAVSLLK